MRFCFDIDGTLCTNTYGHYEEAEPLFDMISQVNRLHDAGHFIILFTARGTTTGIDWRSLTEEQMARWGVRYHNLQLGKPEADIYIDDKGMSIKEWAENCPPDARPPQPPPIEMAPTDNVLKRSDYLTILYSDERRPQSDYPRKLAEYLKATSYGGRTGRLLDIGCGRADMLKAFAASGFDVTGVDISPDAVALCHPHPAAVVNLETDPLPFAPGSFDLVFSKSVIEHLHNPIPVLEKANAMLKPGGIAVIMTPSWMHHSFGPFYLDYTHVTPFTAPSLRDALKFSGFTNIEVKHFHQLPFLWRYPALRPLVQLCAQLPLPYAPMYDMSWQWPAGFNKFLRFSKEVMLLAVAHKAA